MSENQSKFAAVWYLKDESNKIHFIPTSDIKKFVELVSYEDHQFLAWRTTPPGARIETPVQVLEVADTKEACEALVANSKSRYKKKKTQERFSDIIRNIIKRDGDEDGDGGMQEKIQVDGNDENPVFRRTTEPSKLKNRDKKKGIVVKSSHVLNQKEKEEIMNKKLASLGTDNICFGTHEDADGMFLKMQEKVSSLERKEEFYLNKLQNMREMIRQLMEKSAPSSIKDTYSSDLNFQDPTHTQNTSPPRSPHKKIPKISQDVASPKISKEQAEKMFDDAFNAARISNKTNDSSPIFNSRRKRNMSQRPILQNLSGHYEDNYNEEDSQFSTKSCSSKEEPKKAIDTVCSKENNDDHFDERTGSPSLISQRNERKRKLSVCRNLFESNENSSGKKRAPETLTQRSRMETSTQVVRPQSEMNNDRPILNFRKSSRYIKPKKLQDKIKLVEQRIKTHIEIYESTKKNLSNLSDTNTKEIKFHAFYDVLIPYDDWKDLKKCKNASKYVRQAARTLWDIHTLMNRAIDVSCCRENRLPGRSPRKNLSPIKLACLERLYLGYVNDNYKGEARKTIICNCHEYLNAYINGLIFQELERIRQQQARERDEAESEEEDMPPEPFPPANNEEEEEYD